MNITMYDVYGNYFGQANFNIYPAAQSYWCYNDSTGANYAC